MQNKAESAQRDHLQKLGRAGRHTSDDYDHAGPALSVVGEPQIGTHNAEQSKEHTDDTVRIFQRNIRMIPLNKCLS